ncbi:AAA family ATPase [Paludisphaera borealis]|uniref:YhaN AAA domain-containing protein n=1 Tax=Paludisphaera borealis TaxID=1387353 RepID=A0A1U7CT00_9BACT|nr:AAA family ATPase [Paludisphaera borealis]APW62067.1 hypothetical protein BSF38_03599 [Paludisphaera borealis]
MRLQNLRVKSYGHFRDLALPLDGEGVQMIIGPNEAGKTTLLEFVRELLFGFAERTPYMFGEKNKPEGSATLVLDSGSIVELNRRKGRKKTVSLQVDGRESDLDDEGFNGLLGHASANLFRSIFAFGLDELAAGEKSLGDQSVKSALYSGGTASAANPKKILEALQAEADKLYKEKSRTLVIDNLCAGLADLSKRVKDKSIRCDAYEQRRIELEQAEAEAAALADELVAATRDLGLKRRLAQAFPLWLELGRLRRERAGLTAPASFPPDGRARFDAVEADIARLSDALDKARKATEKNARELADVRFDPRLIERRAEIEGLNRTIQAVKDARQSLPVDQQKRDEALRKVTARLGSLVPDWSLEDLRGFRLTAPLKAKVDLLTKEHDDRAAALNDLAKTRDGHLETLHDKQSELFALGEPVDVAPLAALLEDEAEYKNNARELKRLEGEYRKTRRAIDDLLPRLNPPLDRPSSEAVELPAPPRETIGRFKRDFQRIEQQIDSSASSLAKDEAALGGLERELAGLTARGDDLPTPDGLDDLRRRRDAGWDLVRRKHVEHEDVEADVRAWLADNAPDAVHDLLDAYQHVVHATDRYADDLFDQSSAVAKQDQIKLSRERIEQDRRTLDGLRSVQDSLLEDWRALWADCGLIPLDPDAMEGWLDRLDELRALRARTVEHEQEGRALREQVATFESRLRTLLGDPDSDGPALLAAAREREKHIRSSEQSRRDLQRDSRQLQDKADRAEAQRIERQGEEAAWRDRWRALLQELRLPADWDAGLAGRVLRDLNATFADLETADGHVDRIAAHQARLAEFEPKVQAIAADLAADLVDELPEHAAATLQARLTDSVQAQERKASLEKNLAEARRLEVEHDAKRAAVLDDRTALFAAAGVETAEAFRAIADRVARIAELDQDVAAKESKVEIVREQEPLDAFLARLDGADGDLLNADRDQAEALRDQVQKRKTTADENVGSRRQALSEYQKGSGEAAELQEAASAKRAELAAAVDRYVPLVFAQHLLKQAIQRFEQDSQPEMLRETSRIFQTMTAGRFTRVERPKEDDGPLLVHRVDEEMLEPHQLSTGTREQLYLAVRLAYVLHYCGRTEALPIVMDDVLANFDDDRARHTLRALGDVSKRVQVILFTCHPHLTVLGREVFPSLRPLAIPTADAEPADDAEEPKPARPAKSRQRPLLGLSPSA